MSDEAEAIASLLVSPVGYGVELFDDLHVYRLESGSFAVTWREYGDVQRWLERVFADAREAAEAFVAKRHELNMGFDHEGPWGKPVAAATRDGRTTAPTIEPNVAAAGGVQTLDTNNPEHWDEGDEAAWAAGLGNHGVDSESPSAWARVDAHLTAALDLANAQKERDERLAARSPRAERVWWDQVGELWLGLAGGCEVRVAFDRTPATLRTAPVESRNYRLVADGRGIHWPDLDEDLSVEGLLAP